MNNKNIAVVGAGYWGKNLVRNFQELGALHTVCDSDPETVRRLSEQYPDANGVNSFAEVLGNDAITGVALATPAAAHAPQVREALLAGKDVYVEKPLCLSESDGAECNQLARERQRILMVGHLLWYHPAVLKLQELVRAGELGRVQYIYSNRLNIGKLRREENVLWSFAPHDISVILGLLDEFPESLQSQGGNFLHQRIADTTVTLLNFASGVRAHIFVSWLHPFKEQKLVVVGDRQMAVFDDTALWPGKLVLYPHSIQWSGNIPVANKAELRPVGVTEEEPLRAECRHFLDCIANRRQPRTDGEEGLRVLRVLNACQQALENGRRFDFEGATGTGGRCFVHDTAMIDNDVTIGEGTRIWHFSHVLAGSRIGTGCTVGQNVMIGPKVAVGDGCKIQNNVSVYEGVTLEEEVFCGPSMVFTNVINPRSAVARRGQFRKTLVQKGATLGANCTIICGITLGRYCFIGAGAVVTRDVPDFALMVGNPAGQLGWMSRYGERLDLPLTGEGETTCPHTGDTYILEGDTVKLL